MNRFTGIVKRNYDHAPKITSEVEGRQTLYLEDTWSEAYLLAIDDALTRSEAFKAISYHEAYEFLTGFHSTVQITIQRSI